VYLSLLLKELETQARTFDGEFYPMDELKGVRKQKGNAWRIRGVAPKRNILTEQNTYSRLQNEIIGKIDYNSGDYN